MRAGLFLVTLWLTLAAEAAGTADGPAVNVRLARGEVIRVVPLRVEPEPGAPQWAKWCAVRLRSGRAAEQALVTIGKGETEALSCDHMLAVGAVAAPPGGARMAMIYRTRSPNAASITPIVITRGGKGEWSVDEALTGQLGMEERLSTIPAIRKWLAGRK